MLLLLLLLLLLSYPSHVHSFTWVSRCHDTEGKRGVALPGGGAGGCFQVTEVCSEHMRSAKGSFPDKLTLRDAAFLVPSPQRTTKRRKSPDAC